MVISFIGMAVVRQYVGYVDAIANSGMNFKTEAIRHIILDRY